MSSSLMFVAAVTLLLLSSAVCAAPTIKASPAKLQKSGDLVTISWTGFSDVSRYAVIGIYYPASQISTLSALIGYVNVSSISGSTQIPMVNARHDYAFGLINVTSLSPYTLQMVAKSNAVTFVNPLEPQQVHLSLTGDSTEMMIKWTSGVPSSVSKSRSLTKLTFR
jgi:hypothetical protein